MSQYDELMAELTPATSQPFPPIRAAEIPRTWWEVGKDTLAALERGSAQISQGMVALPVDALNFVNQFSPAHLTPASWGCVQAYCHNRRRYASYKPLSAKTANTTRTCSCLKKPDGR